MDDFWNKYNKYLNSTHWRELRESVITERGRRCELTGLFLLKKETHVHHWIYRQRFEDAQPEDLSVLGEIPHQVIHYWIKTGKIDREAPDRLEKSKELYQAWLKAKYAHKKANKYFRRLYSWLKNKGVVKFQPRPSKKRKRNKIFINRGRGFSPPRLEWLTISEYEKARNRE